MTTEDDFQRALDAHPDDWQTRLVFADWLEECAAKVPCLVCHASGLILVNPGPDGQWIPCPTCRGAEFVSDPRAEGYRALGRLDRVPRKVVMNEDVPDAPYEGQWLFGRDDNRGANPFLDDRRCLLPFDWFARLPYTDRVYSFNVDKEDRFWEHFPTRREAEDAAANAFARLTHHSPLTPTRERQ